jgi:hypothetical protein
MRLIPHSTVLRSCRRKATNHWTGRLEQRTDSTWVLRTLTWEQTWRLWSLRRSDLRSCNVEHALNRSERYCGNPGHKDIKRDEQDHFRSFHLETSIDFETEIRCGDLGHTDADPNKIKRDEQDHFRSFHLETSIETVDLETEIRCGDLGHTDADPNKIKRDEQDHFRSFHLETSIETVDLEWRSGPHGRWSEQDQTRRTRPLTVFSPRNVDRN